MFKNLKTGDSLEISILRNGEVAKTYKTRLEDPRSPSEIIVHKPYEQSVEINLSKDINYQLLFFTKAGLMQFKGKVVEDVDVDGIVCVKLELLNKGKKIQRREFFRYTMNTAFPIFRKNIKGKFNINRAHLGIINDIGAGGLRFVSNVELQKGEVINIQLPLEDEYFIGNCRVLYIDKTPEASIYKYQYRVKFDDLSEDEKEEIVQFIFNEQKKTLASNANI